MEKESCYNEIIKILSDTIETHNKSYRLLIN
ncbi:Uncharacterised protein [[Clostridium] sordellii]|nr:Uncharacterised protein [[Clostridium] sordellii] [Paeniclostridium sordellii]